ncbi:MAG: threonine/serine exporter family protein [Clostridia bacterium]|nr:threonine/serine exporter family protein [Clostridia bacterium]MBO7319555.1 threonine/serine exporter family protein [Clostridia bacterium]
MAEKRHCEKVLSLALDIAKNMVKCGAEVNRAEQAVMRICYAYGMEKAQVFSVVSMIIATVVDEESGAHSQMRRSYSYGVNFGKLEKLNALSRRICTETPDIDVVRLELESICVEDKAFRLKYCFGYMLAAASFAVFFGGNFMDAIASVPIAALIYFLQTYIRVKGASRLFFTALESAVAGFLALLFVHFGFGNNPDMIMIGDIMVLIPGLQLINAVREMLHGDLMSGMLRLLESVILAVAIALGFAIPVYFWGYMA